MKRLPLFLIALPSLVMGHPHDAPFTFIKHTMNDGHPVYTNIPQSCFRNGIMTCWNYHPVAGNQGVAATNTDVNESSISMKEPETQVEESAPTGFDEAVKKLQSQVKRKGGY